MGGNGANTCQLAYLRRPLSPEEAVDTETPHCTFGMRGPSGQTSPAKFRRSGSLHREIIATSGSYYGGNGANTCQLAYLRRHFHRKRWTLRRHIALLAMRGPSGQTSLPSFVALVTYSER
ncbi:hypothetical protein DPMN_076502 [Dreissena polymorpha]|uniref:Uncharacterized protein n=1 Tax=Dreissena polymorpha TaxID=45954 RepID=A0A9D3YMC9_DREPO|nr:hypothetical protein DPMN_076502 [Dreissena polymorpha]